MPDIDTARFAYAMRHALSTYGYGSSLDPDELDETIGFLADEVRHSGIALPTNAEDDDEKLADESSSSLSLEELEQHPLTSTLEQHLVDLVRVEERDVPMIIDELLAAYKQGVAAQPIDSREKEGGRYCELCERAALLTEHHLIPRTEHDLFIKRGFFTLQECRTRLAMLCRPCHSAVHRAKTTRELAAEFNSVEKLLEIPEVHRFAEWNAKRKVPGHVPPKRPRMTMGK